MVQSLNLYYVFYVTAQCRSISGAAKRLYISQPAVSKAVSKLEENFASPLLYRSPKGVELTENGTLLFRQLDTAFQAIALGEAQVMQNETLGVGKLSVGGSTTLCKYVLLPYLKGFIEENPNIKVSISCQSTYETVAALQNGSLDIGLVGESERIGGLVFQPLKTIQDVFVSTQGYLDSLMEHKSSSSYEDSLIVENDVMTAGSHMRNNLPQYGKELLSRATLLLLDKNNVTRQYIDRYLILNDIMIERQLEVTTMDLLIDFAKISLGVACVIKEFIEKELENNSLILFPTEQPIPKRKIGLAYAKSAQLTPPMQKFMKAVII